MPPRPRLANQPESKKADQMKPPTDNAAAHEDSPAPGDLRTARLLVAGQFVLIGILVVLPNRHDWPVPTALTAACSAATFAGLAVMVIGATGLGRGLTATPLPNAHARLRTGGLYRYARHPIYSGLLLTMASVTLASGSGLRLLTLGALALLLNVKARWEETRLAQRFEGYADYAARTPRFVPRLRR
jgi:protein-S-isoprenylcysteine O-methyltransferase Ste14